MDFYTLPPEVNSARMYSGPGSGPMLAAAAAWQKLGEEVNSLASAYRTVITELIADGWRGPSSTMMANAIMPYVAWMHRTAAQAEQTAARAHSAATAYQAAYAATVPPTVIAANRAHWLALVATNFFGQNSPAIATAEADYEAMWARDTAVMNGYAVSAASASNLASFISPPATTNPADTTAAQTAAAVQSVGGPAQTVPAASFTLVDVFNDTVSSLSGAASVSSSSFGGASIGTTNRVIAINAERDAHQGFGPFLGIGPLPPAPAAPAGPAGVVRPAVSALTGRASLAGALSVPHAWAATPAAPMGAERAAAPASGAAAAPMTPAAFSPGMFGESMLGTLAGRGVNNAAAKARRPSVIPRSPAAG